MRTLLPSILCDVPLISVGLEGARLQNGINIHVYQFNSLQKRDTYWNNIVAVPVILPFSSSSKLASFTTSNLSKYVINVDGIVNGFKSDTRIVFDLFWRSLLPGLPF